MRPTPPPRAFIQKENKMKLIKDFFLLNLKDYTDSQFPLPIGATLTVMLIALCAVFFVITYRKRYTVALLRALIRKKATCEDDAKTLAELKLHENGAIKRALSRSGQLTYIVKRAGENKESYEEYIKKTKEKGYREEKTDFDSARYYINEERMELAKSIIEKTNTSWWIPAICSVFCLAVLVLCIIFLPDLLSLL